MSENEKAKDARLCFVYTTIGSVEDAEELARSLVNARLAACVNFFPAMRSVYRWEGLTNEETEVAMLIKTAPHLVERVFEKVNREHPYDTPALLVLPIETVSDAYGAWAFEAIRTAGN